MRRTRLAVLLTLGAVVSALVASGPQAASTTVVINEVDYDQASADTAEFLELKNVSGSAIDLDPYAVQLVNGTGGAAAVYDTIELPTVSLAAGDYFVVCANNATVTNCDLDDGPNTDFIQNGAPDAIGLRNGATLVDAVSYEGDTTSPYTEGSGSGLLDDPNAGTNGLSRCPDGTDTDTNSSDFVYRPSTPGTANTVRLRRRRRRSARSRARSTSRPLAGQFVQTSGMVTALRSSGGGLLPSGPGAGCERRDVRGDLRLHEHRADGCRRRCGGGRGTRDRVPAGRLLLDEPDDDGAHLAGRSRCSRRRTRCPRRRSSAPVAGCRPEP